ncbi:acyl-CoA thioesterase [Arhodomonas sp. SL1]|uniref:acyl-CoA thioesterase n=1 Tax=Arhodomonas sp. SL1 TaxID=3425691 RepID=UPI003F884BC9
MSEKSLLAESEFPVRWGDQDALGHVNNTVYFRYFEQVRIDWMHQVGIGEGVGAGTATGPVLVNAYCEFRRSIVYPATVRVRMLATPPRRSSVETFYEIRDGADAEVLYASGTALMVWVDHHAGHSIPIPEAIRTLLPAAE